MLVLRVGAGATPLTTTTMTQVYIDEYLLPTAGAGGVGALLQSLTLPSTCTLAPSVTTEGPLTLSADGKTAIFSCFANSVGSASQNPVVGFINAGGSITPLTSFGGIVNTAYQM